jgi:hypothetical protein
MTTEWPEETPEYWEEVTKIVDQNPPSDTFKTDWVAKKVPLYSKKMTSFDVIYLSEVMEFIDSLPDPRPVCKALRERPNGHSYESYHDSVFSPSRQLEKISVWTVKSLHHWVALDKLSSSRFKLHDYDHIIEVGAGIGETARMAYDAFKFKGKYTILDLPAIAQFSKKNLEGYPIEFVTDLKDLFAHGKTLVISTWGLSETELDFRKQLFDTVGRCDVFVAFQSQIFGIDNRDYFIKYLPSEYNKSVRIQNIPMHTIDGGNFYLFAD